METRRIRRIKQRHLRRVVVLMTSIGAVGLGVGLALPRSTAASVVLLGLALPSLATIGIRADSLAPSHGLDRVVRLSTMSAISTAFDSLRSRIVGTGHRIRERVSPQLADFALDLEQGADELAPSTDLQTLTDSVVRVKSQAERPNGPWPALPAPEGSEPSLAGRR